MNNRKLMLVAFIAVALIQLYIPASMIFGREQILSSGKEFKFRAAPVDPNDPFRGKYLTLNFLSNTVEVRNEKEWTLNESVYVILTTNQAGFAEIKAISKKKPKDTRDFVRAKVGNLIFDDAHKLTIEYPFVRFYMEETKAPLAEIKYNNAVRDSTVVTYALVSVKNGEAVIKDVLIDGVPIDRYQVDKPAH